MDVAKLAEYLGEWLKELIKTIMEAFDFLKVNFGTAEEVPEEDAE